MSGRHRILGQSLSLSLSRSSCHTSNSDFRQVPDTQEVYTTEDGAVSLVVEILDVVKEEGCEDDLWKAIK
jgi:hypothetical protein